VSGPQRLLSARQPTCAGHLGRSEDSRRRGLRRRDEVLNLAACAEAIHREPYDEKKTSRDEARGSARRPSMMCLREPGIGWSGFCRTSGT
jgi:hypothetical protein